MWLTCSSVSAGKYTRIDLGQHAGDIGAGRHERCGDDVHPVGQAKLQIRHVLFRDGRQIERCAGECHSLVVAQLPTLDDSRRGAGAVGRHDLESNQPVAHHDGRPWAEFDLVEMLHVDQGGVAAVAAGDKANLVACLDLDPTVRKGADPDPGPLNVLHHCHCPILFA